MISNTLTQKKSIMSTTIATHILVFPYPAHGHMPALLDLTHQLALRGLKITILVTPKNLPSLTPLLSAHPTSIKTLILPFPPHPRLLSGVENVKDIGNSGNAPIISSLSKLKDEVIAWFRSHPSPPQAIISDFFLGFTQHWATQLNIPRLAFFSVSSFLTCILKHLWENLETRNNCDVIEFLELPRTPCLKIDQLPSIYKKFKEGDPDWEAVKESLVMNSKSWGYVYNSFYELEGEFLDHVPKILGHGRVYTVGPLSTIKRVNPDSDTTYGLFKWLDTCPDDSVVYVCFGSQTLLTEPQIKALASALERSKTRFIWVIKSINIEQIPSGFEEQVSDRGIVIRGWAPQVEILNHKAVGGFVNHCGWNSMFESLMAGVMLLVWPMEADQFVNGKIVVEFKGIAVKLCEGEYTIPDSDKLAQTIKESFGHDVPQKVKAKEMREKALEGMKAGGRSSVRIDELVEDLRQIKYTKYDMEQC